MKKREEQGPKVEIKSFLENPIFQNEFIFTKKRKREKEISFEEKISIKNELKLITLRIPLRQKIEFTFNPWEPLKYAEILKSDVKEKEILKGVLYLDKIFDSLNLVRLTVKFYIEENKLLITEIDGESDITSFDFLTEQDFLEKIGNSYIFCDDWFVYSLLTNHLFLEGINPSIVFFNEPLRIIENLSKFKPKIFILKKETFEETFLKKGNEKNFYFYIYNSDEKTKNNLITSEREIEEIARNLLKR